MSDKNKKRLSAKGLQIANKGMPTMIRKNSETDVESVSTSDLTAPEGPVIAEEILKSLIAKTATAELPQPYKFLTPSPLVRKLVTSPAELAENLSSEFTTEDLQRSGLFRKSSGPPCLARVFGNESGDCNFMIPEGAKTPAGLFSERGVIGRTNSISKFAYAKYEPASNHEKVPIFLAPAADFKLLAALDMRIALVDHLRSFRGRRMFERDADFVFTFILMDWQFTALTDHLDIQVLQALKHLWAMENVFAVDVAERFQVWCPDEQWRQRFEDAARCADLKTLQDLVKESVTSGCRSPIDFLQDIDAAGQIDLVTARNQLIKALGEHDSFTGSAEVVRAGKQYARAHERSIVQPCYAGAANAPNAIDRLLYSVAARIAQHFHAEDELLLAVEDIKNSRTPNVDWKLQDVEWEALVGTAGLLAALKRATK